MLITFLLEIDMLYIEFWLYKAHKSNPFFGS